MTGARWVVDVRAVLRTLPWGEFEKAYSLSGRTPYAPAAMVGLILLGVMLGASSLREIEKLARFDLRAWWICGGIKPDHSVLGRFIQRHSSHLTLKFFEDLTRKILKVTKADSRVVALDGTVVAAAASRFQKISLEASRTKANQAEEKAKLHPGDVTLREAAIAAECVHLAAETRAAARRANGEDPEKTMVCATEPEAAVLKGKRGNIEPAYIPSVTANTDQIVLSQRVDRTDEASAFGPLVEQAQEVSGQATTVTADGNYCKPGPLQYALEKGIDFISPTQKDESPAKKSKSEPKSFPGRRFAFNEASNTYRCPAGQTLSYLFDLQDKRRKTWRSVFQAPPSACLACPLRSKCFTAKQKARRIYRAASETLRDAMRQVLSNPRAKAVLRRRKVMVEPVFARLRALGLDRFGRSGVAGASVEFSLYCCAHNLLRMVALMGRRPARAARRATARLLALPLVLLLLTSRHLTLGRLATPGADGGATCASRLRHALAPLM